MSRTTLNRMLIIVTAVMALLAWFLRRDVQQPNYVFTPEMVFSIPYDSFASNPNFPDGKTAQLPVAGTVARSDEWEDGGEENRAREILFDYEPTEADAVRAGVELTSPWSEIGIDADELLLAKSRGQKVYSTFCLPCHGAAGGGTGPVTNYGYPPPPSFSSESSLNMSDGQMFHILTFGQRYVAEKNMPSYAAQISPEDRWKAILHVRSIQEPARLKAEGQLIFERLNCDKCHTVASNVKPVGPDLRKIAVTYSREQLLEAILHPSKTIAEGFVEEKFETIDGDLITGFVTEETEEQLTIRYTDGQEIKEIIIPVDDIEVRRISEKSPMPDGLIKELADDELQSLLDYLKSIGADPGPVEPAQNGQDIDPANDQNDEKDDDEIIPNTLREEK